MGNSEVSSTFLSRVLESGSPSHAYLFFGPPLSPKEEKAFEFGKALLCRGARKPCHVCAPCAKVGSGNHPDFRVIKPEGEKIKIEQIRTIKGESQYPPFEGAYKIYLLTESQSLTEQAAQSMLKLLEEPPSRCVFILLAPHPTSLLPTIASRCQRVPFQARSAREHAEELNRRAGSQADARLLTGLEIPLEKAPEWEDLLQAVPPALFQESRTASDIVDRVSVLEDYKERGAHLARLLYTFYRDVAVLKSGWEEGIYFEKFKQAVAGQAANLSWGEIRERLELVEEARAHLEQSGNFRLVMENLFLKLKGN